MKRRLLNLLTALSLLLCVAFWVRSYFVRDVLNWTAGRRAGTGHIASGQLGGVGGTECGGSSADWAAM